MGQVLDKPKSTAAIDGLPAEEQFIDLRSDTVTRPTPAMREAMVTYPLGDDVYGGDPTVRALEARMAERLGMEAGLFLASGTQSNLSALMAHCGRGDEYIAGDAYHVYCNEAGGAAVLGGISPCPIPTLEGGAIDPEAVRAAIKPDDAHYPRSKLVCLENTVSGRVVPLARMQAVIAVAREHGLAVHLDGARLMNAAVALGVDPKALTEGVDSVSLCLSKGLCAPVGTVLCASRELIERAHRVRKLLGGAMRQSGVLAACGLVALDQHIDRLAEDHANARALAEGLADIAELSVDLEAVETNMAFVTPNRADHGPLRRYLKEHGILIAGQEPTIRLVTHHDVSRQDIDQVIARVKAFYTN